MKTTMIAAGMLALTALATLPGIASEGDSLEWTSVIVQCGHTPEAGDISCEARTGEMGWAACTVRAFGKEYVLPEAALAKLKGFPLSSLETTHEVGYEELGGYTVHFRFARTVHNPENKVVTEIIYVSVNKNGISDSEPRPKNNSLQGAGAESPRVAPAMADELRVTLEGGGISGTFPVTPTETSCGRLNWDGVPDKDGAMSGGQCEITVQLVDKAVVLKEHTLASDKGIRSDIIAKTIVPTAKVPWTGKISQTTVSVFCSQGRAEPVTFPTKAGEYSEKGWKYVYEIQHQGTRSEQRTGRLFLNGKEEKGVIGELKREPIGFFIYFGEHGFNQGWLNTLTYDGKVFEKDGTTTEQAQLLLHADRMAPEDAKVAYRDALVGSLHGFAEGGDLIAVKGILESHPELINARRVFPQAHKPMRTDGFSLLHRAAGQGRGEIVTYLIGMGADVNAADAMGWTPLHLAAQKGSLPTVKQLVTHGALVDAATKAVAASFEVPPCSAEGTPPCELPAVPSLTPLDLARAGKHAELVAYLTAVTEPARDAATIMPRIRASIEAGPTFEKLSEILGEPDVDIGSGIHIFVYRLSDGTGIRVGTPDKKAVSYVFQADNRLFPIEAGQTPGGQQPFDEVLWVERLKPEISLLYLVFTNAGGHDENVRLVVSHAAAALREAAKHQGHEFNVVCFVRPGGMYTGFSVEQLREITAASPKRAEELVGQHTWGIGELPKPAAQGGAVRLEPESTAPTPRDIFPSRASGEQSDPRH